MEIAVVSRSDVGRVRTNNEDNLFIDQDMGLYAVCDGMGGHNAGEVASHIACEVIHRELLACQADRARFLSSGKASDAKVIQKAVENAMSAACREIFRQATKNPEQGGMGTTATLVLLIGNGKGILGHVGDSRLVLARHGQVRQLSEDHTYVNDLVKRGAITLEQSKHHPQGNVLSRAVGVQPSVAIDTMIFDVDPGDTLLVCSDGLYNYFPDPNEMLPLLRTPDLNQGLNALIDTALERGGHDNCTGILLRLGGQLSNEAAATAAERRIAILKKIPIFTHLSYHELVKVLGLTQLLEVKAGTRILTEGDQGDELFVVLSGEIDVTKGGNRLVTLKAGTHLGEMAMIDNAPRSASATAITDCKLLSMRRDEFFGMIRSEPVIATKLLWSFVKSLSGRLRNTNEALQGAREELAPPEEFEIFVDGDNE